jgi:hypothetical protein
MPRYGGETDVVAIMQRRMADLEGALARLGNQGGNIYPEPWRDVGAAGNPAFQNSWVNYDTAAFPACAFRREAGGVVRLKGLVKNGSILGAIFTLPAEYRPARAMIFPVISNSTIAEVRVGSNGTVIPQNGNNVWLSIDSISFVIAG